MSAFDEIKGRLKKAFGDLTARPDMQREGEAQETKGSAEREAAEARMEARAHEARAARASQQEAEERRAGNGR